MRYTVQLYRYDLTGGLAEQYSAMLLGMHVDGVWHTSIVVYNKEYYFDGGVGIITELHPGHTRFGTPYKIDTLGQTTKSEIEFKEWIDTFNYDNTSAEHSNLAFGPNDYHLLDNNCNHFTQAASRFLLDQDIPSDIREMIPTLLSTPLGCILRPVLERATHNTNTFFWENNDKATKASNASPESRKPPNPSTSEEQIGKGLLSTKTSLSEDENDDLITIQAMLETNPYLHEESKEHKELQRSSNSMTGLKLTCKAITVLESVLQKIIAFPCERKYRTLSTKSNTYQSYLLPLEEYGVREVLRLAGFTQRQRNVIVNNYSNNINGDEAECSERLTEWILKDEKGNASVLQRILEAIQCSKHNIENMYETNEETDKEVNIFKHNDNSVSEAKSNSKQEHNEKFLEVRKNNEESDIFEELFPSEVVCTLNTNTENNRKCQIARNVGIDNNNDVSSVDENNALNDIEQNMKETLTEEVAEKTDKCHSINVSVKDSIDRRDIYTTAESQTNVLSENLTNVVNTISLHEHRDDELHLANALSGEPINSLERLIRWREPLEYVENSTITLSFVPPFPCTRAMSRVISYGKSSELLESEEQEEQHHLRLLVCHDMQGGYLETDNAQFSIKLSSSTEDLLSATAKHTVFKNERNHYLEVLAQAYDVRYWPYVDYFVYFSHHRVTIPPADWVASAHRNGVPILGTLIMEGSSGVHELNTILLSSAHNMAIIVRQLVRLCNYYRFDGYLLNFECNVDPSLVSRVKLFVTVLREELNKSHKFNHNEQSNCVTTINDRSDSSNYRKMKEHFNKSQPYKNEYVNQVPLSDKQKRFVIWYDALTTQGEVRYQNALTALNKPFYDRADGILLNYFWQPHELTQTVQEITGHPQRRSVFVGIDVFGRHMYDGGQFNSVKSVQRIANAGLSVGLFAPGWTLEMCHYAKHNTGIVTKDNLRNECVSGNNNNKNLINNSDDAVNNEISSLQYYRQLRHEFGLRESKLWEPMLYYFTRHTRVLESVNKLCVHENKSEQTLTHENFFQQEYCKWLWTCFCDALGLSFFVNGKPVNCSLQNKHGMCNSIWCQRAMQQDTPPLSYSATSPENRCFDQTSCLYDAESIQAKQREKLTSEQINPFFYLYSLDLRKTDEVECKSEWKPAVSHVSHYKTQTKEVIAEWCESVAWFGNRSLRFTLAPLENVVISDWIIKLNSRKSCDKTNTQFIPEKQKEGILDNLYNVNNNNNENTMTAFTKDRIKQEVILVDVIYKTNHVTQNKIRSQRGVLIQLEHRLLRNKENVIVNDANVMTDMGNSNIETVLKKLTSKKSNLFTNANDEFNEDSEVDQHKQISIEVAEVNESDENSCRLLFDSNCNNDLNVENYGSNAWSLVRYIFWRQCKTDELSSQDASKICEDSNSSSFTKSAESMVTAVAIVNKSVEHTLFCQVGGVGVTSVSLIGSNDKRATRESLFAIFSPLMPLRRHKWLNFNVNSTHTSQKYILCLENVHENIINALGCKKHSVLDCTSHDAQEEKLVEHTKSITINKNTPKNENIILLALTANVTSIQNKSDCNELISNNEQMTNKYNHNVYLGQHYVNVNADTNLLIPINMIDSSCTITAVHFHIIEIV